MNTHRTSTPAPTDTRPIARTVRAMRVEVLTLGVIAFVIVIGSVAAAVYFEVPWLALGGLVAAWPALSAYWLNDLAARTAEHLPQRPPRTRPHWARRLWWWFVRRQVQRAAQPKPWRGIAVAGVPDAVKIAYQPGEAAHEHDPVIVAGMTAKDLYHIAQEADKLRTLDERSWRLTEFTRVLPSGPVLSRGMFRKAQSWFVDNGLADKRPYYHLCVSLDDVARKLQEE